MKFDYTVKYDQDELLKDLGLEEKGLVQQFIVNQVLIHSTPYVPFDVMHLYENPGLLRDSGRVEETDVVWSTPYARYLYYHPEFNFQGAPLKGGYWVERAMQNGGLEKIRQGAQKLVNMLAKGV